MPSNIILGISLGSGLLHPGSDLEGGTGPGPGPGPGPLGSIIQTAGNNSDILTTGSTEVRVMLDA